jgi:hypothetical protein
MWKRLNVKYAYAFFCRFLKKIEFSRQIFENVSNIICPVGAELFHAEEQTDGHEANIRFWQFYERD